MCSNAERLTDKSKEKEIKVVVINKPTKEETIKKIKELSVYLSEVWNVQTNAK